MATYRLAVKKVIVTPIFWPLEHFIVYITGRGNKNIATSVTRFGMLIQVKNASWSIQWPGMNLSHSYLKGMHMAKSKLHNIIKLTTRTPQIIYVAYRYPFVVNVLRYKHRIESFGKVTAPGYANARAV
jgi:hypothetical protein